MIILYRYKRDNLRLIIQLIIYVYEGWEHQTNYMWVLTSDEGESAQAGEGADVDLQEVKGFAEVENTVQPIAETALTLFQRQDDAVAEHQLRIVRIRAVRQPEHEQFQAGWLEEQFLESD